LKGWVIVSVLMMLAVSGCGRRRMPTSVYRPIIPLPPSTFPVQLDPPPVPVDLARTLPSPIQRLPNPVAKLPVYSKPKPVQNVRRRARAKVPVAESKPDSAPAADVKPADVKPAEVEVMELGEVMPSSERRAELAAVNQTLAATNGLIQRLTGRRLTPGQQDRLTQIQDLAARAQAFRATDLGSAKAFADRAMLLARDLAGEVR
jgi:hypothetical protein